MRAIAIWGSLTVAACGPSEALAPAPTAPVAHVAHAAPAILAHGPRLGDDATPIRYDLTLELDPSRDDFTGHVAIAIDAAPGTQVIWLHAVDLAIHHAQVALGAAAPAAVTASAGPPGTQMIGFLLPGPASGRLTLTLDYTGHVRDMSSAYGKAEEGLFRERADGDWYLFSQAESVFARRIVPCFDEPRWKPTWQVTAIVPHGQVALGNAPEAAAGRQPDGRRAVRFADITGLPSYLVAIAVGPFAVIDAGRIGRNHIPLRLAVQPGDAKRVAGIATEVATIAASLEGYVDAALPLAKLDLVAVPKFFGAMENPGLITFARAVLVGGRERTMITAHELAHQWFGDAVTPAWWDDLWLAEGFATWLGQRVASELGQGDSVLDRHDARAAALAADDRVGALAIVHPVDRSDDVEPMFDAIGYDKAAALLAAFEQLVGRDALRTALRRYVADHAGRSVTSRALFDAVTAATGPEAAAALAANLTHAGVPAVEIAVTCAPTPVVHARSRDGIAVPVCVRDAHARRCVVAGADTTLPWDRCPAWLVGNADGQGYYRVIGALPPLAPLSPDERLARGDDVARSLTHGELGLGAALDELGALAQSREPYAELAGLTIARAIDGALDDADRPAWAAWLAARYAHRLTVDQLAEPARPLGAAVRDAVVELARGAIAPDVLRRAGARLDHHAISDLSLILWVDTSDAAALFARVRKAADNTQRGDEQHALFESLGAFPASYAPRLVELVTSRRFAALEVWQGLAAMLARGESRTAAWRAIHDQLDAVVRAFAPAELPRVIAATGALCDAAARAQLATELPRLAAALHAPEPDTRTALDRALATIDGCVARRAALGHVAQTLAAWTPRR